MAFGRMGARGGFGSLGGLGKAPVSAPKVIRNISTTQIAGTTAPTVTAPKVRLVGTFKRYCQVAAPRFKFSYMSAIIKLGGAVNSFDFTINKLVFVQNGVATPLTFGGLRSHTVTAGTLDDQTDWGPAVAKGGYTVNYDITVSTSGYPACDNTLTSGESDGLSSVQWLCDPAATGSYDIDTFGAAYLTIPTGGVVTNPLQPWAMLGEVSTSQKSVCGGVTSLEYGTGDILSSDGALGGGYQARAAYSLGLPYIRMALPSMSYADVGNTVGIGIQNAVFTYCSDLWVGPPANDVVAGTSQSAIRTLLRAFVTRAKAKSVTRVIVGTIMPRVTTTDNCMTLGSQTPVTGNGSGGVADGVNTDMAADVGAYYNALVDLRAILGDATDPHLWSIAGLFSSTLASAALSTDKVLSLVARPPVWAFLICDPFNANGQKSSGTFVAISVTGTGPYAATCPVNVTIGVAQNNGNAVNQSPSRDGIHPYGTRIIDLSTAVVAAA